MSKLNIYVTVFLSAFLSFSAQAQQECTIFGPAGATCVCATLTPDMFSPNTVTSAVFDHTISVNQTFNLVLGTGSQFYLSASDVDDIESSCDKYLDTLNTPNSAFNYTCGQLRMGPVQYGCYQGQNGGFYGCASIPYVSEDILRTSKLDASGIQKAQCEEVFEATIYLTDQDKSGNCPSDFFHPHKWYNDQKKTLDLISQNLNCK